MWIPENFGLILEPRARFWSKSRLHLILHLGVSNFFKSWSLILKPWFRMQSPKVSNLLFYALINVGLRVEISWF